MRKFIAATAGFALSAGMALAQIPSPTPAPEGAVNGPIATPQSGAAGKTTPNDPHASKVNMASPSGSATSSVPTPQGAPNEAVSTPDSGSAGKTGISTGAAQ